MMTTPTTTPVSCSDLLRNLQNLGRLFDGYLDALCSLSRRSLQLAMATESHLLLTKLIQMERRWASHLPLFEYLDVDFNHWGDVVRRWHDYMGEHALSDEYISYRPFVPDTNYFVDLYDAYCYSEETVRHYDKMSALAYIQSGDTARRVVNEGRGKALMRFEEATIGTLGQASEDTPGFVLLNQSEQMRQLCREQFALLSERLFSIDAMLRQEHPDEAYSNLYERTVYQRCRSAKSRAVSFLERWRANHQKGDLRTDASVEFRVLQQQIDNHPLLSKLNRELHFDQTLQLQHVAMGRFLFEHRSMLFGDFDTLELTIELFTKMELLQQVVLFGENYRQTADVETEALDACFTEKLRKNPLAIQKLIGLLQEDLPSIGTKQRETSGAKKWGHVYEAFQYSGVDILKKGITPNDFGRCMHQLAPTLVAKNIAGYIRPERYSKEVGQSAIHALIKRYSSIWK